MNCFLIVSYKGLSSLYLSNLANKDNSSLPFEIESLIVINSTLGFLLFRLYNHFTNEKTDFNHFRKRISL